MRSRMGSGSRWRQPAILFAPDPIIPCSVQWTLSCRCHSRHRHHQLRRLHCFRKDYRHRYVFTSVFVLFFRCCHSCQLSRCYHRRQQRGHARRNQQRFKSALESHANYNDASR